MYILTHTTTSPLKGEMNGQLVNGSNRLEGVLLVAESDDVPRSMRIVGCEHSGELFLQLLHIYVHVHVHV